jgi:hypothetical protein
MNDALEPSPKRGSLDPGAGNDLIDNKVVEDFGDLQASNRYTLDVGHSAASIVPVRSGGPRGGKRCHETGPTVYRT